MFLNTNKKSNLLKAACLGMAILVGVPAVAEVTRVSDLVDVDPTVWAYKALKELVEKYDVLEGYPDGTFKGNRPATRYELAQALYEVIKVVEGRGNVPASDMADVNKLKSEFSSELDTINAKLNDLNDRVGALEVQANQPQWTDRIKVSGDLTNTIQTDWASGDGNNVGQWGTRARLGVDAILIGDDGSSSGILGEGIAHILLAGGNGGGGTAGYQTSGSALNDIFASSSNPGASFNNSLYSGRVQDSRMNAFIDSAYYTQVFKFSHKDPCSDDVNKNDNIFLVADLGQQNLWKTFHKSLVREDSLDGFINSRILRGVVGSSDATTEALHIGLNILGGGTEAERTDECGNVTAAGVDDCGNPLPSFFQALSLDYAFAALKAFDSGFIGNTGQIGGANTIVPALLGGGLGALEIYNAAGYSTNRVWDNHSHNVALNLLYDLPGEFLGTGLLTVGYSGAHVNYLSQGVSQLLTGTNYDDSWGHTFWAKWEQWFTPKRTFGLFADYTYATNNSSNWLVNGPVNQAFQLGLILNTNFLPEFWNFNKDQLGAAYSIIDPFNAATGNNSAAAQLVGLSANPSTSQNFRGGVYQDHRPEQIFEIYYRKYITENISITPDLQLVLNGNGNNTALSGIIRATFKLPNWNDGGAFDQFGYRDWSQRIAKYRAQRSSN